MIFRPELCRLVVSGKKTQTRRLMQEHDPAPGDRRPPRTIVVDGVRYLYPYAPLDSVAVQPGRGKHAIARIVITSVERQHAGDITYPAAVAEGFRTTDEFKAYWVRLHDRGWVMSSEYPEHNEFLDDATLVDRFDRRHADRMVWAISFEIDRAHRPRLLAPAGRPRGDELGYTQSAAHALRGTADAGEALDPAVLEFYAQDAQERFAGDPGRRMDFALKRLRSEKERARRMLQAGEHAEHVIAAIDQFQAHLDLIDRAREAA